MSCCNRMVHALAGRLPSLLTLLMSLSPLWLPEVELLLWVQPLPICLWTHFVVTYHHDANCCCCCFFKQMIIESFLISPNMEKSRIQILGKYSLFLIFITSLLFTPTTHKLGPFYRGGELVEDNC